MSVDGQGFPAGGVKAQKTKCRDEAPINVFT